MTSVLPHPHSEKWAQVKSSPLEGIHAFTLSHKTCHLLCNI